MSGIDTRSGEMGVSDTARIMELHVKRYRVLRDVRFAHITPLMVLLGPNGSGKSTVFDVFEFLSECFQYGLRYAWDRRGRAKELKTRGEDGPVEIEIRYRESSTKPTITYHLAIDEGAKGPVVTEEWLQWSRKQRGRPFKFLEYRNGEGAAVSGDMPDEKGERESTPLRSPDLIAVNTLGQFAAHPRVAALREFITDWYVSYLSIEQTRGQPEAGPRERLSKTGDNLLNVIQYLMEHDRERLERIFEKLRQRVPRLERVEAELMQDGRLLLQLKDAPFDRPILARYVSDGTLKMLSYLTILMNPEPPEFIGIEEPENFLHPRLLPELAEECREASERSQLLVTTHSPFLLNAIRPEETRVLYRDDRGHSQVVLASELRGVREFMDAGASMGQLWLEGQFGVGDPLAHAGAPGRGGLTR